MKTILKRFISSLFMVIMSLSCSDDNKQYDPINPDGPTTKGVVSLAKINVSVDLSLKSEVETKSDGAINTDQFHVTITSKRNNTVVGQWLKADMPSTLEIYTGDYEIRCTNLDAPKSAAWEQPHYVGTQTFKVLDGETTVVDNVVCKLANMSVSIAYSETMISNLTSYSTSVTNNLGVLAYEASETRKGYFSAGLIVASFKGVRKDGSPITKIISIPTTAAGDAQVIKFDVNTKGNAVIGIKVDATVNDKVVNIEIVDDGTIVDPNPDPDPEEPENPDNPEVKPPVIEGVGFDISQTMTLASGAIKDVDVKVTAPNGGIKTLDVIIDSPTLGPLLDGLGIPSNLDLVTPTPEVKELLIELKLIGKEPVKGKTEFKFSIGSFMPLLPVGTHKFKVVLTDESGAKTNETLTIIVS